ncbi:hypothetical protein AB0A69_15930 [Streptomyces sp. NPDC045431]|uniref:hypothetical protein n=1 Tax=Streptomyces sp. NPDC045431 TaxID=3155613 RepID=UPI003408A1E1
MTRSTTTTTPMSTAMTATATRHDRRMYALMNRREATALYATAARRRAVVGAHVLMTLASIALWLLMVLDGDALWPAVALLALVLPWCVATGAINAATRGLLELRGRMLDERQLTERDRVRALAHRITTGLLLLAAAGMGAVTWFAEVRFEGLAFAVLFSALVIHWVMPLWVAGLRAEDEPDPYGDPVAE